MPSYPAFADAQEGSGVVEGEKARSTGACLGEEKSAVFAARADLMPEEFVEHCSALCDARVSHSISVCRRCDRNAANITEADITATYPALASQDILAFQRLREPLQTVLD